MTRRYSPPFRGKRFVGDLRNNHVHDLDNEVESECKISEIGSDKIKMFPMGPESRIDQILENGIDGVEFAPCPHCLPKDYLDEILANCKTDFCVDFHAS